MRNKEALVFGGLGAVLFAYVIYPFAAFFTSTRGASIETGPGFGDAVVNSLVTAPVATVVATVFGVPLAYFLARAEFRGKGVVEALIVLPLVLPPVVGGAMLLTGFGRFTTVGALAETFGVPLTDSLIGVVLAQTFVASPFVVVTSRAGFSSVDEELEHASRTMGHGAVATFWNVSLPSARNAVAAGVVLTFARAVGEFGATMMVAYNPRTMPTLIWVDFIARGIEGILAPAIVLIGVSVTVIVAVQRLERVPSVGE